MLCHPFSLFLWNSCAAPIPLPLSFVELVKLVWLDTATATASGGMILASVMLITMQNPPVALGQKDHMATTRSGACDPTMSQGMWAKWACYSKDGARNNQQSQEKSRGLVCLCPTADPLYACAGADRSTDVPDQGPRARSYRTTPMPGTRMAVSAARGHSGTLAVLHRFLSLPGAGDEDQRQHDMPPVFAPDDARPGREWCHYLSLLSRCPCLTHDTEKVSPAAASIN